MVLEVTELKCMLPRRTLICHIIFRLDFGGLENGLVNLINCLPSEEYVHTIICLEHATEFRQRIRQSDVKIYELHKKKGKDISMYWRIWKLLRQIKPDIVHTRNIGTIDMLLPAYLSGVKKLVHGEHGLEFMELEGENSKYNLFRRVIQVIVKKYIVVSHDLLIWLNNEVGVKREKISLIYNGVDIKKFHSATGSKDILPPRFAPDNAIIIGSIGRMEEVKDQMTLVKSFVQLLQNHPELYNDIRLIIVGDGRMIGDIRHYLKDKGVESLVWLPGFCDNVADFYRLFDVFVLSSKREGVSNTILEAMACGLPVIATDVGGNPEIVMNHSTGQLVAVESPDDVEKALLKYISNPLVRKNHGNIARARALSEHSLTAMVEKYRSVYQSL